MFGLVNLSLKHREQIKFEVKLLRYKPPFSKNSTSNFLRIFSYAKVTIYIFWIDVSTIFFYFFFCHLQLPGKFPI